MKDVVNLTGINEKSDNKPLIHEDLEAFEKLKTEFDKFFTKAEEEASEFKLHELI